MRLLSLLWGSGSERTVLPGGAARAPRKSRDHPNWSDPAPCAMLIDEVDDIWAAIARDDDWSRLNAKVAAIRRMGEALA